MATKKKEETDIGEYLKELAKNWGIMVPSILLAAILGVFIAMWIRPVYQVDALLQIESKNNKGAGMMGELRIFLRPVALPKPRWNSLRVVR